jgi:hypothetical protein
MKIINRQEDVGRAMLINEQSWVEVCGDVLIFFKKTW